MKRTTLLILFVLSLCILPLPPATKALARASATGDWFFVVVETQVHFKAKEIDDDHPAERRWYISNVVVLPANVPDYSEKKKAVEYFDKNVIEAAEKHGLAVESYDQDLEINGGSVIAVGSRAAAEELRNKDIESRKEMGGNIYSFNFTIDAAKGEETSQPRLLFRDKRQPNYEPTKN